MRYPPQPLRSPRMATFPKGHNTRRPGLLNVDKATRTTNTSTTNDGQPSPAELRGIPIQAKGVRGDTNPPPRYTRH